MNWKGTGCGKFKREAAQAGHRCSALQSGCNMSVKGASVLELLRPKGLKPKLSKHDFFGRFKFDVILPITTLR